MKMTNLVGRTIIGTFAVFSMTNVAAAELPTTMPSILFGSVEADCRTINAGTKGWTCQRTDRGQYKITFKSKLPNVPVCQAAATATKKDSAADDNVFTTYAITKRSFMVESLDVAGNDSSGWAYQDASFNFICMWMP
jgi:hypothetical protein